MDVLRYMARFFWRRDSESAVMLSISLTGYFTRRDLRQLADYFAACAEVAGANRPNNSES